MASDRLVVSGPLPPSSNSIYYTDSKTNTRHLTRRAREYRENLQEEMMVGGAKKRCPEPPFSLHYHFRLPDRRRRDLTNLEKLLEDSIFQFLGHDDSLVYDSHKWKYINRENPGVTVELRHCSRELEAS